jgi:hypothetical protein
MYNIFGKERASQDIVWIAGVTEFHFLFQKSAN